VIDEIIKDPKDRIKKRAISEGWKIEQEVIRAGLQKRYP
jgi:hypothetical protein